jgi:hypothetical protein
MYRQLFVPNAKNNSIAIPRKWYGTEVEVLVFPVGKKQQSPAMKKVKEKPEINYTDIKQVLANADPEKLKRVSEIFDKYLIPLNDFKFDRDEANNYD